MAAGAFACLLLPGLPPWLLLGVMLGVGFVLWLRIARLRLFGALLFGFGLVGMHATSVLSRQLPLAMEHGEVVVQGRIIDLPHSEPRRTRFRFRVDRTSSQPAPLRGKMLQLAWYDEDPTARDLQAGARWEMKVKLRAPRGLRNPGGFDSEKYALAQRLSASGYVRDTASARPLSRPQGIEAWRDVMSRRIAGSIPSTSSRFIRALALGDTRDLGDEDWETLRATGLTHLIAISGFHVGLVAGFFALLASMLWRLLPSLARRLPRPHAAAISALVGACAYTAVAGFALPTVRTTLMIAVIVAARLWRRPQHATESLALAAIVLLILDPLALLAPGFWLSFVGVGWLLWCLPQGTRNIFKDFLSAQGVATLGLLPLTVALFGQASLAGPLANLVAVPWWSLVVVPLSLIGTALEALHEGWGLWIWRQSALAFDLTWPLFDRLGNSGIALWWLPDARWYALPLALLGAIWLLLPRGVPGKPLALLLWLPLLWPDRELPGHGEAEIVVIDVGQGLSLLVRTSRHALLYDMGPAVKDGFDAGDRAVVPALHALGVRGLDAAVVSHGDNDHAGGLDAVLRRFPVRTLMGPAGSPTIATHRCIAGTAWRWNGVTFRFLHPPIYFPYFKNESSCVLRIETLHGSALLTGDIGEVIERDLLRLSKDDVRSDVVLMAHHGSAGSSDTEFVTASGARFAVASAGYGNRFRHPKDEIVARWRKAGAHVASTVEQGALRIRFSAEGIDVTGNRDTRPRLWDAVQRSRQVQPVRMP
ncbi:MAG: DNA internalization-related competence protein ComEC/Rec2 [Pseudomonadota bacterium]|nr:DNA internalization-related competence protein ComEC/Rec2 [Pseudomonadota bacterium]